ncbi:MAG: hypothetical protein E7624_05800 [Ruminococcaceae bacterium]|nr:hypothetical protein [Oscillospiraceae bacterium]
MKKRIFTLLLAVILLIPCAFLSCHEEVPNVEPSDNETPPEPKNYGTLYTDENGRLQNDLITVEITNESLVAPVTKLSYNIYNESACYQSMENVYEDLEMKINGEWVQAPAGVIQRVHRDTWSFFRPQKVRKGDVFFELGTDAEYFPLEPGEYRLIVTYPILMPTEIQIYPTVEFTVVAPTE